MDWKHEQLLLNFCVGPASCTRWVFTSKHCKGSRRRIVDWIFLIWRHEYFLPIKVADIPQWRNMDKIVMAWFWRWRLPSPRSCHLSTKVRCAFVMLSWFGLFVFVVSQFSGIINDCSYQYISLYSMCIHGCWLLILFSTFAMIWICHRMKYVNGRKI